MEQVLIISGPAGAGKTAVALALCERFDRMLHVPVDDLRHWVVAGYRHPWIEDQQALEQRDMACESASALARIAIRRRYAAVIDDVVLPPQVEHYRRYLGDVRAAVHMVTLLPSIEVCLRRDAPRPSPIPDRVRALHQQLSEAAANGLLPGHVLDSSDDHDAAATADRVQDTVSRGLARFS